MNNANDPPQTENHNYKKLKILWRGKKQTNHFNIHKKVETEDNSLLQKFNPKNSAILRSIRSFNRSFCQKN